MPEFIDDNFWSRVRRTDTCWIWIGARNPGGYGNVRRDGRYQKAHRYCFSRWHAVNLDSAQYLAHSCDTPACVNPAHLRVASQREIMAECAAKNRIAFGRRSGNNKLTEQQVLDIRANYVLCRVSQAELAERYSVSQPTVHHIVHGRYWRRALPAATGAATMG